MQCHYTAEIAQAKFDGFKVEIDERVARVLEALDAWAADNDIGGKGLLSWEYTSEGGPDSNGQKTIPDEIKKARFLYYYVVAGGGNGVHNPDYVRDALVNAEDFANNAPDLTP